MATVIILIQPLLVPLLTVSALIAIILFNLLFVFLLFPLEGPLLRKVALLFAGNFVGALWYLIQASLQEASILSLSPDAFKIVAALVNPVLDFIWVVSLWSLSLSVIASAKKGRTTK